MPFFKRKPKPSDTPRAVPARLTRAISVAPQSVDLSARTFQFVLSTETPVRIFGCLPDIGHGEFDEVLVADGMDDSRLGNAPIADSHNLSSIGNVIGVVDGYERQGATWTGTGRLSKSALGEQALTDIADGILRQVSVGYTVQEYAVELRDGQVPLARAVKWTPHEISVVAVGADPSAIIRAADISQSTDSQENSMDPETLAALQAAADSIVTAAEAVSSAAPEDGSADDAVNAAVDAADSASQAVSDLGGEDAAQSNEARSARISKVREARDVRAKARADDSAAGSDTEKKPEPNADEQAARSMARKAGLSKLSDQLFAAGASAVEVRSALLNALVTRSEAVGEIVTRPAGSTATESPKRSLASDVYARMNKRA